MKSTAKTIGLVMIIMVFSRLASLVSNMIYMPFFGVDNREINIYSYAVQLPNVVFAVLGTALTTIVIPIFAGYIGTGEKNRAYKFANDVISLSVAFTALLALIGIIIAPVFPFFTTFRTNGYDFAVIALRIMFPIMIFYALNYILQGILQSLGKFNMPAFVSVPSSLIIIFYIVFLGRKYGVEGLLIATFIGLTLQALILIPPIFKTEYRFKPSFDYKSEDIKKALRLIPPILIGTSAYQINIFFNITLTARFENMVTLMAFVQNIILYSILAFIYSITAVVFPKFTFLVAKGDMDGLKNNLVKVLRTIIYFLIPATFGFIAVRYQLVDFLVGWGKVTPQNVSLAGGLLSFYAIGVTGIGIKEVVDRAFYSLKDTKKPAINGIIIMAVNIGISLILIQFIGVYGIPLAYSMSALTGAAVLIYFLRKKIGAFGGRNLAFFILKVLTSSAIMFFMVYLVNLLLSPFDFGHIIVDRIVKLGLPSAIGAAVYVFATYLFKLDETIEVLNRVKAMLPRIRTKGGR